MRVGVPTLTGDGPLKSSLLFVQYLLSGSSVQRETEQARGEAKYVYKLRACIFTGLRE